MRRLMRLLTLGVAVAAALHGAARGDIIHLKTGRVEGIILKHTDTELVVETTAGKVILDPADVVKIERKSSPLELYREMLKEVKDGDAEAHYKLALWCFDQRLFREANAELRRTIEIDPDHEQARQRLGYVRRDGQWLTRAEAKRAEGFVRYKDKWVTKEQRAAAERRQAAMAWHRRLRAALAKAKMTDEEDVARRIAAALGDQPSEEADAALRLLLRTLSEEADDERRDRTVEARVALMEFAAQQKAPEAAELVRRLAITDPHDTVRGVAVQALKRQENLENTAYFVGLLQTFTGAKYRIHGDKKTRRIARRILRRAAQALGELGDPRAVPALANALIVRFHIKENTEELPPLSIGFSTTAMAAPSGVISDPFGNQMLLPVTEGSNWGLDGPEDKNVESGFFFNDAAYNALRSLTGQDFSHNKRAWLAWWYRNRHEFAD